MGGGVLVISTVVFLILYWKRKHKETLMERVEEACKKYFETMVENPIGGQVIKGENVFLTLKEQMKAAAIKDAENRMDKKVKEEKMRVLHIDCVLKWPKMCVYEDINQSDVYEISYKDAVDQNMWKSLLILSWRWWKSKPEPDPEVSLSPAVSLSS